MATMRLCSWLLVAILMSLTVCEARGLPRRSALDGDMIAANAEASLELIQEEINRLIALKAAIRLEKAIESSKQGCNGFPCVYTHLGSKAGQQALKKALLDKLNECAHDPNCSPGKRRRRSATAQAVLSLLTRDGNRTS